MIETRKRLKEIKLFREFSEEELDSMWSLFSEEFFPKGSVIWEEGSPAQGLRIIDHGKVKVLKKAKDNTNQVLTVLTRNSFFGELSLLDGRSHSASVEAVEDTKLMVLRRNDMDKLLQESPQTAFKIVREMTIDISELLREMNNKYMFLVNYVWE